MRNPGLRLVGLTTSPSGGGVFGTRAEEELRHWLESRLDALGIDPVAYSRFVLSLLRRPPDSALSPLDEDIDFAVVNNRATAGGGSSTGARRHLNYRVRPRARISGDRDQRRAVVQCLTNAADQKCGVEPLVDELCAKLRNLEGSSGSTNDTSDTEKEESKRKNLESVNNIKFETLTPRDKALRYYAAFPALQPATPKKNNNNNNNNNNSNINNNYYNHNNNINNNNNNNKNNNNHKKDKTYSATNTINNLNKKNFNNKNKKNEKKRKPKMSIRTIDRKEDKETFGFAKSMERERDKERELEMDKIKLAQLQAKFDESLEALWDSGPGNAGDTASIWAAPSLSIPSGPLWPVDPTELLILPIINDDDDDNNGIADHDDNNSIMSCKKIINSCNNTSYYYDNNYHHHNTDDDGKIVDETIIPWDIGIIGVSKFIDDSKDKIDYNLNWSDYGGDGPWNWKDLGNNLITIDNPKINSFYSSPHDDINLIIKQQRQQQQQQQHHYQQYDYKEKLNNLKNEIDIDSKINNDANNIVGVVNNDASGRNIEDVKINNEQEQKQKVDNENKVIEVIGDKEQLGIDIKNKDDAGKIDKVKEEKKEEEQEEEEDLLTSARTHFRPIKDDGNWADGTTFPVNNNYELVNYRRSSSGNILYLPNDDNPYMEYHETIITPSVSSSGATGTTDGDEETAIKNFTLKFRVKQCDKSIQTDPIRSPVKRRIIAETNHHFYYTKLIHDHDDDDDNDGDDDDDDDEEEDDDNNTDNNDDDDNDNILTKESYDTEKDSFMLDRKHWIQPSLSILNDRKRRHSSSFNCRPLVALRPLTL